MNIKIGNQNEFRIYPDIENNRELPDGEKFAVVLAKRHRMVVQTASVTSEGKFDLIEYAKSAIVRIENAPMLDMGKLKRAMTVQDIFEIPELENVATEIFTAATQLQKNGELETKN